MREKSWFFPRRSSSPPCRATQQSIAWRGTLSRTSKSAGNDVMELAPLLIHFDINKTTIHSDKIQDKAIEQGIREGIADLFWGYVSKEGDKLTWEWMKNKPCCNPPSSPRKVLSYSDFCKEAVPDKKARKDAISMFTLVDEETRQDMEKLVKVTLKRMQLPHEVRQTHAAEQAGLNGGTVLMCPSVFHFIAALQRSKRKFAVLFRSFGTDHETIMKEWNAFCEMRHPLYSNLLQGIGALDGSVPGIPDRRIHRLHTMYRDSQGPVLILNILTNGARDNTWDSWAKANPKPKTDTRNGRDFLHQVLQASTIEGLANVEQWMRTHLQAQRTSGIKDDWAWWRWHDEQAVAGKLLTVFSGTEDEMKQMFFDDNIGFTDARIVDVRDVNGAQVAFAQAVNKVISKVNPVEALLDDEYFLRKLQTCHGEHLDAGVSLIEFQRQLTESEDRNSALDKHIKALSQQLKNMSDENRRMKLLHRIHVRDEAQLRDILAKDVDLDKFGKNRYKSVSDLFNELDKGHCWLEHDEHGKLVRIFEMVFLKIQYKDMILIESHETDSDKNILTRSYLPGVRKQIQESCFTDAVARWFESGLEVNLRDCITLETLPIFVPEAPHQTTHATQAYPIPCRVQQSQATYVVDEKSFTTHKEQLSRIGLPGGKHFTSTETQLAGGTVTHFWHWDKIAAWEATTGHMARGVANTQVDTAQICDSLFHDHPRREAYERLLLSIFETFTAKKLCGGFSGSVVIRVQPFEAAGKPGDPCIVKLDSGDAIREEFRNSENVFKALPDNAAKILGEAVYVTTKDEEYGALRLELAGACWNIPELAQGAGNLLSTFKDLLLYESAQTLLGSQASAAEERPFGNVNSVLAETFGPGGIVSSLRKGGQGLRRAEGKSLLSSYTLKGKETQFNPYTAAGEYPPAETMRKLYRRHFGEEMPDLPKLVKGVIKPRLDELGKMNQRELCPLVGLAHGDLNAANIMIDALDAVWLIDFATSVEEPLFTDMCKFEMACLFEYATIPITPKLLLDFASTDSAKWSSMMIGDWLRVDQDIAEKFMNELLSLPTSRLESITQSNLDNIIQDVATRSRQSPKHQAAVIRNLKARLVLDETEVDGAFSFCANISRNLLQGDYIFDTLNTKNFVPSEAANLPGIASLRFFMDIVTTIRKFMSQDIFSLFREFSNSSDGIMEPCDALSLQIWLPFLRESFRIIGYGDIAPQQKLWSIHHCKNVATNVIRILDMLTPHMNSLRTLPIKEKMLDDLVSKRNTRKGRSEEMLVQCDEPFSEVESHWIHLNSQAFAANQLLSMFVRKVHAACPLYNQRAGFFAPIFQILDSDNEPVEIDFDAAESLPWKLELDLPQDNRPPRLAEDDEFVIGNVAAGATAKDMPPLGLKSRLLFLTKRILQASIGHIRDCTEKDQRDKLPKGFSVSKWSSGLFQDRSDRSDSQTAVSGAERGRKNTFGSLFPSEDNLNILLQMPAYVKDENGRNMMRITVVIGDPVICYPGGSRMCLDAPINLQGNNAGTEVIIRELQENGIYCVTDVQDDSADVSLDFDPAPDNHVFLSPCLYKVGDVILLNDGNGSSWMGAEILNTPKAEAEYQWELQICDRGRNPVRQDSVSCMSRSDSRPSRSDTSGEIILRHLSPANSGLARMSVDTYEEEVRRMKVYFRARHSFIIDSLSGQRLDFKCCAVPTLLMFPPHNQHFAQQSDGLTRSMTAARFSSFAKMKGSWTPCGASSTLSTHCSTSGSAFAMQSFQGFNKSERLGSGAQTPLIPDSAASFWQDVRQGWSAITSAMERHNQGRASCFPNAFLVFGPPGSGKSCMVSRIVMDCLERHWDLVPVMFPIADMVKRTDQDPEYAEVDTVAAQTWFVNYLRVTLGDDSSRYKMVRQAISAHRVLLLFEGLEDGGEWFPLIECLIRELVLDRHLVIVTSRPLLKNSESVFEDMDEFIQRMDLLPLTTQQMRLVAGARLGLDGLASYDQFFTQFRQGTKHVSIENGAENGDAPQEDVFSNPMMLSMLICYIQMHEREREEHEAWLQRSGQHNEPRADRAGSLEHVSDAHTLTDVYRVAVDVMLARVQSKQQADRFNKEEKVAKCKRILEKMAMKMQVSKTVAIEADEFEKMLASNMHETWEVLKAAVAAGHAMFLRMSPEAGRLELRFLVKGFQSFFAASELANGGGSHLPGLVALLTDSWWAQMLEMLAEKWPQRYARLIESKLERWGDNKAEGNSIFHIAAKVGHRPLFELVKLFSEAVQTELRSHNKDKQTPLHIAAERGDVAICSLLIEHKAPLDVEDSRDRLPLHSAMQHEHFDLAKFLLNKMVETQQIPRRHVKDNPAVKLGARILGLGGLAPLTEAEFNAACSETFVELSFFWKSRCDGAEKRNWSSPFNLLDLHESVRQVCEGSGG